MTAGTGRHRPACGPVTVTYHRRNQLLARLGLCAAGGLVVGGLLAIPFSGGDDGATLTSPSVSVTSTTTASSTVGTGRAPTSATVSNSTGTSTVTSIAGAPSSVGGASSTVDGAAATTVATGPTGSTLPTIPGVDAPAYVVIDADTGDVLGGGNAGEQRAVGSV